MRKIKKLSAAAAVLAALTLFAGCNNTGDSKTSASSAPESTASVQESSKADESSAESKPDSSLESSKDDNSKDNNSKAQTSSDGSSSPAGEQTEDTITPAVWEAVDQNGNSIYLMGSMHLALPDAVNYPGYYETAYAKCDALAVECDVSNVNISQLSALNSVLYTDGTKISDHVPKDDYEKAKTTLQNAGTYMSAYDYYKPIMWTQIAEVTAATQAGLSADYGADTFMIKRAKEEGKEILELESVEYQYEIMAEIPEETALLLFKEIGKPDYTEETAKQLQKYYDNWSKGTLDESILSPENSLTPEQKKLIDDYNQLLIFDRNKNMEGKIKEYLASGKKVMVIAGAAHFYGDKGILQLLENDGYKIRRLTSADADPSVGTESKVISLPEQSSVSETETDPGIPRAA